MLSCCIIAQNPALTKDQKTLNLQLIPRQQYPWLHLLIEHIQKFNIQTTGQLLQHSPKDLKPYWIQLANHPLSTPPEHTLIELEGAFLKIQQQCMQNEINLLISSAKIKPLSTQQENRLHQLLATKTQESLD